MMPDPTAVQPGATRTGTICCSAGTPGAVSGSPIRSPQPPYRDPQWPWPTSRFPRAGGAWAAAASVLSSPGRSSRSPTAPASPGSRAGTANMRAARPGDRPGGRPAPWTGGSACSSRSGPCASHWGRSLPMPQRSGPPRTTSPTSSGRSSSPPRLPAVRRGGVRADHRRRGAAGRRPLTAAGPARPDRLVGRRYPVARHPVVQPDHPERPAGRVGASPGHHPIWRPDAVGSVCFLVSSWLAWVEECHGPFAWRPSRLSWWITSLNLVGSVVFGVSAVASYVTSSGQLLSVALTNLGTFVGAICFLVGALLLLPERTLERPPRSRSRRRRRRSPWAADGGRSSRSEEPAGALDMC